MKHLKNKIKEVMVKYFRRKHRTNTQVKAGNPEARIIINKSNKYITAQVVDASGKVLASVSDKKAKGKTKTERAFNAGVDLAKAAKDQKIEHYAFDRNGYLYHGRVKSIADGIREGGLKI